MGAVLNALQITRTTSSSQASRVWLIHLSRASQGKAFTLRTLLALYVMRHNVRVNFVKAFSDFEGILLIIDLVRESPPCVKWSPALHDTNYMWQPILSCICFCCFYFYKTSFPSCKSKLCSTCTLVLEYPTGCRSGDKALFTSLKCKYLCEDCSSMLIVTQENINWSTVYWWFWILLYFIACCFVP